MPTTPPNAEPNMARLLRLIGSTFGSLLQGAAHAKVRLSRGQRSTQFMQPKHSDGFH